MSNKPTVCDDKNQLVKESRSRRTSDKEEIKILLMKDEVPQTVYTLHVSSPHTEIDLLHKIFSNSQILQSSLGTTEVMATQSVFKVTSIQSHQYLLETMAPCISSKICITPVNDAAYQYVVDVTSPIVNPHQFNYFENVFNSNAFSDVTLCVDGKEIFAHKVILANRSPVFDALLSCEHDRFEINYISYDTLFGLLHYVYKGVFCSYNPQDEFFHFSNLLIADSIFCVEGLKQLCEEKLLSLLTVENAVECLILADAHGALTLKQQAIDIITENAEQVIQLPSHERLALLHRDVIMTILQSVALKKEQTI